MTKRVLKFDKSKSVIAEHPENISDNVSASANLKFSPNLIVVNLAQSLNILLISETSDVSNLSKPLMLTKFLHPENISFIIFT